MASHARLGGAQSTNLADNPAALIPAAQLSTHLQMVRSTRGDNALRGLAHSYIGLWSRTFRSLVRQLRGRPEHALRLWCNEVYPFLRGDQHAAKLHFVSRHRAEVSMPGDLPEPYLAGLLESFVGLSGAKANAVATSTDSFQVTFQLHPSDQAARLVHVIASLRIPLLLTSALASLVGIAWSSLEAPVDWWRAAFVVIGAVSAQSAANGVHDLRQRSMGPLDMHNVDKPWRLAQVIGSGALAIGALTYLVATGSLGLLWFAAAGLILAVGYTAASGRSLGPLIAIGSHGPLMVAGAAWAMQPELAAQSLGLLTLIGLGPGLLTAALLTLGDIADRPMDEASGRRTLAVRLPERRNLMLLTVLSIAGVISPAMLANGAQSWLALLWFLPSLGIALAVVRETRRFIDDPHRLARARISMFGLHVITILLLITLLIGGGT